MFFDVCGPTGPHFESIFKMGSTLSGNYTIFCSFQSKIPILLRSRLIFSYLNGLRSHAAVGILRSLDGYLRSRRNIAKRTRNRFHDRRRTGIKDYARTSVARLHGYALGILAQNLSSDKTACRLKSAGTLAAHLLRLQPSSRGALLPVFHSAIKENYRGNNRCRHEWQIFFIFLFHFVFKFSFSTLRLYSYLKASIGLRAAARRAG